MKKDKKYLMDKLTCGLMRMKGDNIIEKLRGLIATVEKKPPSGKRSTSNDHVSYGEMIPEMSKEGISQNKTPTANKATNLAKPEVAPSWDKAQVSCSSPSTDHKSSYAYVVSISQKEEKLEYSVCSVCHNKRPSIRLTEDFNYAELYQATNRFSSENFLSEGGFGSVYAGELKCGLKVAVKQHNDASFQGEKEFKSEVDVLTKARHPNLVMLLGSCSEGTQRLLVYEFVCYGSLDQHLSKHELTWEKRIKIALGAARGLDYLHSISIIHRDMRPNNILVTHDYESMLGDFGLARTTCGDTDETRVVGTLGYVAPEYAECGRVSTKTDVYSFGVVLLQLITGCKTKEKKFEEKTLVEWARPLLADYNYPDLIDERIVDPHDLHVIQLYLMVNLAEDCLKKDPAERDTMGNVVKKLEYIMEVMQQCREVKRC